MQDSCCALGVFPSPLWFSINSPGFWVVVPEGTALSKGTQRNGTTIPSHQHHELAEAGHASGPSHFQGSGQVLEGRLVLVGRSLHARRRAALHPDWAMHMASRVRSDPMDEGPAAHVDNRAVVGDPLMPPIFAASSREAPSSTDAIANNRRRACAPSLRWWANRRTSPGV
jgi:hypothetical protein